MKPGPGSFLNLAGQRFAMFVAIRHVRTERRQTGGVVQWWLCLCDCGRTKEMRASNLAAAGHEKDRSKIRSCGCLKTRAENLPAPLQLRARHALLVEAQKAAG